MIDMVPSIERREHRRFIVSGRVRLVRGFDSGLGTLVNLGEWGILFRRPTFRISPARCPIEIEIEGQVVGVKDDRMAVRFLEKRQEVSDCLRWLASENCPWTGTVGATSGPETQEAPEAMTSQTPESDADLEAARELLFRSA
jgi:hypothetical protein